MKKEAKKVNLVDNSSVTSWLYIDEKSYEYVLVIGNANGNVITIKNKSIDEIINDLEELSMSVIQAKLGHLKWTSI